MTIGEKRVRTSFNPSANTLVDILKQNTATLINHVEGMRLPNEDPKAGDVNTLVNLAATAYEEAAMWAVEAATA
jgi:hypothetical protein